MDAFSLCIPGTVRTSPWRPSRGIGDGRDTGRPARGWKELCGCPAFSPAMHRTRRRALRSAGAALAVALAGCFGSDPEPATFTVTAEAPETAAVSEEVTVTWTVRNEGDLEDTQQVRVSASDEQIRSESLTLDADEQRERTVTVSAASTGALPVTVTTDDDEVTVTVLIEGSSLTRRRARLQSARPAGAGGERRQRRSPPRRDPRRGTRPRIRRWRRRSRRRRYRRGSRDSRRC